MRGRWYVRAVFVLALAFSVASWITSHYRALYLHYATETAVFVVGAFDGYLSLAYGDDPFAFPPDWGFRNLRPADPANVEQQYADSQFHVMGFGFDDRHVGLHVTGLWVPWWFLTVVMAGVLVFSFRKPRVRPGFPIMPDGAPAVRQDSTT